MAQPGGRGVDVRIDESLLRRLCTGPDGPVFQAMVQIGQEGAQEAKRRAPVGERGSKSPLGHPSGWLRSQIGWQISVKAGQVVVDVISPAVTSPANPKPGEPYALYMERPDLRPYGVPSWVRAKEGPYLVPGVEDTILRVIRRNPWMRLS